MFATSIRWLVKTFTKNEFDNANDKKMIEICKFCQIIEKAKTEPGIVLYQDDHVVAFKDIRPQAKLHYLILPREHIKNIGTIKSSKESLEVLERMERCARDLLMQNSGITDPCSKNFRVGFHRSFATSQDHLHLHGFLLPCKTYYKHYIGYAPPMFFASIESVKNNI